MRYKNVGLLLKLLVILWLGQIVWKLLLKECLVEVGRFTRNSMAKAMLIQRHKLIIYSQRFKHICKLEIEIMQNNQVMNIKDLMIKEDEYMHEILIIIHIITIDFSDYYEKKSGI